MKDFINPAGLPNKREPSPLQSFFGPVSKSDAANIIDHLLNEPEFPQDLAKYLEGEIDGRDLLYRLQVLCENIDDRTKGCA